MIAAIYARKSTEQNGVGEDAKSVTRQVEHAKAYAEKKGWAVDPRYIYIDDAVSGAEWKHRPEFNRLLAALDPKPPFEILVVSELSRIGRDTVRAPLAILQIEDAGVNIYSYLNDSAITMASESGEVQTVVQSLVSSFERRAARDRTHDSHLRKARSGHVVGGRTYGYDNEVVLGKDGKKSHVRRVVNPDQAGVVRRIFERYGAGHGITRIAKALNADRIAPPRTRKLGWAPTAVREILYRDLYRGVIVWDKLQKIVKRGTKTRRVRPESEWTRVDAPELRIVDDALWDRVRERLDANQASYARVAGGKLRARPARVDLDSKYLLSGFLVCAECGHTVTAAPRTVKGGAVQSFYRCTINWKRGHTVCGHNSIVSIDPLHEETFAALAGVLDERVVSRAFERALDKFKADHSTVGDRRAVLDREIEAAQGRERNLARAVALLPPDGLPDAILTELKAEQARRQGLERERAELDGAERFAATSREALKAEVSEALSDLSALLTASVPQARQALRWLGARFALKPVMLPDGRRGVEFSGVGSYAKLFSRVFALAEGRGKSNNGHRALSVVSPTGFDTLCSALPIRGAVYRRAA